jgi:DNA-binding PadR family transcriptional regulator
LGSDEKLLKWITEYKKGFSKPIILLALAKKENYPYNLTREITERTKGQISIAGSNIYPILKNLVDDGLIQKEKVAKPTKSEDKTKQQFRSIYSLTTDGKELLKELKASLKDFNDIIRELIEE